MSADIQAIEAALMRAWDRVWARISSVGFADASPEERAFAAVWLLEAEVNNGGFAQYMFNSWGDHACIARDALVAVGAQGTLAVFDALVDALPNRRVGADRKDREMQLELLAKQHGEETAEALLQDLDERFYASEDELRERMHHFALANGWI